MGTKKVKVKRHKDPVSGKIKVKASKETVVVVSDGDSVSFEVEGSGGVQYYLLFFDEIFAGAPMAAPGALLPVTLTVAPDAREGEYDYVVHCRLEEDGHVVRAIAEGGSSPKIVIRL
jgi:hypothetical protein